MKIKSPILDIFHVDPVYSLMSARYVKYLYEMFKLLDFHNKNSLNDVQFLHFMRNITDLKKSHIYRLFDMVDVDGSGVIEFDEFHFVCTIIVAIKDHQEKQFIHQHCRPVFLLLDADNNNTVSAYEFQSLAFLFNFSRLAVSKIFREFDVSGDQVLDYQEFRLFAMACIDLQKEIDSYKGVRLRWFTHQKDKLQSCWSGLIDRLSGVTPEEQEQREALKEWQDKPRLRTYHEYSGVNREDEVKNPWRPLTEFCQKYEPPPMPRKHRCCSIL